MAFLADGTMLLSVGEGYTLREDAQKTGSQLGKLLRMTETGEAPADNPFPDAPTSTATAIETPRVDCRCGNAVNLDDRARA